MEYMEVPYKILLNFGAPKTDRKNKIKYERIKKRDEQKQQQADLNRENKLVVAGGGGKWVKEVKGIKSTLNEHRVMYRIIVPSYCTSETNG